MPSANQHRNGIIDQPVKVYSKFELVYVCSDGPQGATLSSPLQVKSLNSGINKINHEDLNKLIINKQK